MPPPPKQRHGRRRSAKQCSAKQCDSVHKTTLDLSPGRRRRRHRVATRARCVCLHVGRETDRFRIQIRYRRTLRVPARLAAGRGRRAVTVTGISRVSGARAGRAREIPIAGAARGRAAARDFRLRPSAVQGRPRGPVGATIERGAQQVFVACLCAKIDAPAPARFRSAFVGHQARSGESQTPQISTVANWSVAPHCGHVSAESRQGECPKAARTRCEWADSRAMLSPWTRAARPVRIQCVNMRTSANTRGARETDPCRAPAEVRWLSILWLCTAAGGICTTVAG